MFKDITGFDWDDGNKYKNVGKHGVSNSECEEVFFNTPVIISNDVQHSESEKRYFVLGKTNTERKLFLVYTVRENKIRIISARDQSRKERISYEKTKRNTKI